MTEDNEPDFAAFEAAATSDEQPIAADENETGETVDAEEPEKAEGDEDEAEKGKRRSKRPSERIDQLTWEKNEERRQREAAEAERETLRAEVARLRGDAPSQPATPQGLPPRPDPNALNEDGTDKYEFGEADPQYFEDLSDWKVEEKFAKRDAENAQKAQADKARAEAATLDTSWAEQAEKAVERYPDFADKVAEYKNEPCPLIMAAAIQSSEFGADVVYHLANNPKENRELAHLAETDPLEAARRFGRLEARFEGKASNDTRPTAKTITDAPEPPKHGVRGSGGRFEVDGSTTDFEAFERAANKK